MNNTALVRYYVRESLRHSTVCETDHIVFDGDSEILRMYIRESLNESWKDWVSTAGHVMLDLAGLIPGVGELADVTNASIYAKKGDYIFAALSLISCIPELGDLLGKGGKLSLWVQKLGKGGKLAAGAGKQVVKIAKFIKDNQEMIKKIFDIARKNEKLAPYVEKMNAALGSFIQSAEKQPQGGQLPQKQQPQGTRPRHTYFPPGPNGEVAKSARAT